MEYYIHYECPKCEGDVYALGFNTIEHNDIPVFDLDHCSQTVMTCTNDIWVNDEDEDDILSEEEFKELKDSDKYEKYTQKECGYQFGTGDIEILGEDEW